MWQFDRSGINGQFIQGEECCAINEPKSRQQDIQVVYFICSRARDLLGNLTVGTNPSNHIKKEKVKDMANKKPTNDRELIDTGNDKRYVRRNEEGQFKESDDVGRSLAQDVKRAAKTKVAAGQGDRGDQRRRK
jgi:hypothetical protein